MQKSLCTSQWKVPHTQTQGMRDINGRFQQFETVTFATVWGVFDSTGPVFNVGCTFASLTGNILLWCKTSFTQVLAKQQSILKIKKVPEISAWNDCHFRLSAYGYLLCQAFHAVQRETGVYISTLSMLCTHSFADQFKLPLLNSFFFFIHYETE